MPPQEKRAPVSAGLFLVALVVDLGGFAPCRALLRDLTGENSMSWNGIVIRAVGLLLIVAVAGRTYRAQAGKPVVPVAKSFDVGIFESGDLIFRRGRSLVSRAVLAADDRSEYSHVGIIRRIGDEISVVHAEPADSEHQDGTVRSDSLSSYLAFDKASAAALYRAVEVPAPLRREAAEIAARYARDKTPFDGRFDLGTADHLYCTELIWRAYLGAGIDLVDGVFDHLSIPLGSGSYILPSRILGSRHLVLIAEI
jgi:Permuted papain-like amidase enzyme, YaeF/YiiX, C92 family